MKTELLNYWRGHVVATRISKFLAAATVMIGLAAPVYAVYYPGSTDFEGDSPLADGCWSNVVDAAVVTDASVADVPRAQNLPPSFKTSRTKVMEVDADEAIVRKLMDDDTAAAASTIYADFLINPLPIAADEDAPEAGDEDKILIYTRVNQSGNATNLCVYAKDAVNGTAQEFVLTKTFGADEWHRIVVKATAAGYQVYCDGTDAANLCKTSGDVDTFYALSSGAPVTSVGFVGTGHVDDIILTDFDPAVPVTNLTWDASLVSVSYTVNGEPGDVLTPSDGSYACQIPAGATVVMTGNNGFRSFSTTGTTLETPTGLAYYTTGDGTSANPYEIPTYEALVAMRDAVASDASYRSAYYIQTADIDGTGKAAFSGIGTYNVTVANGVSFSGTYDGQSFKISNISLAAANYAGIFNQVDGGTIKNLTVENISGSKGISIVGHAANGTTLQGLTATGSFGTAESPAAHNAAGIVVRVGGGASADAVTTIQSCTNNATIYGTYSKIGGIAAIVQGSDAANKSGKVVFVDCVNNGDIRRIGTATDTNGGFGGILAYATFATEIENCVNNGTISATLEDAHIGQIVGHYQGNGLTDLGGNSASSASPMLGTVVTEVGLSGFQYATVENGVATTIDGAPIAGGEYLLEGNAAPVIALDDGDTIAFDTALGYTLDDTGITAAEGLVVVPSTVGTVTTYATAARGPYLEPATQELFYNCTSAVSVVDAPEGATFYWQEEVIPGTSSGTSGGISFSSDVKPLSVSSGRKADTVKFYSNSTNGIWHLTAFVTNDNAQVAQLIATVTVKDVAAVVDGVEYTRAQWSEAIAAAKTNDKVLGIYLSAPAVSLAAGESLQVKVLATRNVVNLPTVTGPAGTDGTVYVVNKVKDSATGITTFSLTAETPSVMFTSADGETTNYLDASFKATAAGTYKLLKNVTRSQLLVGAAGVVLDLNGKTFTSTATGTTAAINVTSTTGTADLTVVDTSDLSTGAIVAPNYSAIQSGKNGTVAIEGGAISGKTVLVYTLSGGTVAISGGSFAMVSGSAESMLNCKDDNRGTITVTGGSFNGFDPATSNAADGDMVATGYLSFADNPSVGWYTVHPVATVTYANWDDAALQVTTNILGEAAPAYVGETPARVDDTGAYVYTFTGWTTNGVAVTPAEVIVEEDTIFKAAFDATPPSYNDPEGSEIQDQGLIGWLSDNGFTQGDIAALGNDAAATDKLYECWLLNCSIKAANPGGALSSTAIEVTNGVISITVQLDRNSPLGYIEGVLHLYGTDDLADGFSLISEEIVGFSDGDSIFDTEPTEGPVTQSVTATFSLDDVSATFFKAVIEFPIPGGED